MEVLEKLNKEWEQFKAENDRRLKEIETKGRADPLTENKINAHSAAIGELQKQFDEIQKKNQRVGARDEFEEAKAAHAKAFKTWMREGEESVSKKELRDLQVKALQTTVAADGGYAIPEELERSIGAMERNLTPMEQEVTSITAGAETYEKLLKDGEAAADWVGETAARPETASPTLASFTPTYGELSAKPKATQKMLDDGMFDIEGWIADEIAQAFGFKLDAAIVSGDGVNKPKGILGYTLAATGDATRAYGTVEKLHSGTAGDFDADDLIDLMRKLRPGYRQGAKFVMAGTTVDKIRKLKDANNQYIWLPGIQDGRPATIFGAPVVEDENVPVVAANANAIIYGNLKRAYKLVNLRGIRMLRDPFSEKPYVQFYTTKRVGGGVEDTRAVKVLTLSI